MAGTLGAAGLLGYAAQATISICGTGADNFFEIYVYNALIFLASGLCLARAVLVRAERLAWSLLGAGLLAWALGEAYYSILLADLAEPPLPSVADAFWLAFYPCCYIAVVLLVRERVREFRQSLWLDGLVGALAASAIGADLVFGTLLGGGRDASIVAVDLAYAIGDLLLLAFVVAIFALTGWRPGRALALVGAGLVTSAVADSYFLVESVSGSVPGTTVMAVLWPASTLVIGFAAWVKPVEARQIRFEGWRVLLMPAAFAACGLALLTYQAVRPQNVPALALAAATLAAVIARMAVTFHENIELLAASRREALTDALTGLGNRRHLMQDLEQAIAAATDAAPCGLMMLDLDGFKPYNDRFGHPMGDALLARVSSQLTKMVGGSGSAYRLGGDEFCVVATGSEQELAEIARVARDALSDSGDGFRITSSCGQALIPRDASDVTHALHVADERLYASKKGRKRSTVGSQTSAALLQTLEEREPALRGHLDEVASLAREVARQMGLFGEQLDDVVRAAQLHDIGKVAIPDAILRKPGDLDASEWDFIRSHTIIGARIVGAAPALDKVAEIVRASHERFDGNGYPDRLAADAIPLGARIVAACDAYHSMTSVRAYGDMVSTSDALEELRRCAGTQFDPAVIEFLTSILEARQPTQGPERSGGETEARPPSASLSGASQLAAAVSRKPR